MKELECTFGASISAAAGLAMDLVFVPIYYGTKKGSPGQYNGAGGIIPWCCQAPLYFVLLCSRVCTEIQRSGKGNLVVQESKDSGSERYGKNESWNWLGAEVETTPFHQELEMRKCRRNTFVQKTSLLSTCTYAVHFWHGLKWQETVSK